MTMIAIVRSLSALDRSVKNINALLTLVWKSHGARSEHPLQAIWIPEKAPPFPDFSAPNPSYKQESDRERSTLHIDQSAGLSGIWMLYWIHCNETDLNPSLSRHDILTTLLRSELQGDHQVSLSIFIPVFSADSSTTDIQAQCELMSEIPEARLSAHWLQDKETGHINRAKTSPLKLANR